MTRPAEPSAGNRFLEDHIRIMRESLLHWSGRDLVDAGIGHRDAAEYLYSAPFSLLSHDTRDDPVFNYANRCAQNLFEMNWSEITATPSRISVEPQRQTERAELLQKVASRGYVDHYRSVRVSSSGRRFLISNTTIWNLIGPDGGFYGQAAIFDQWKYLDE